MRKGKGTETHNLGNVVFPLLVVVPHTPSPVARASVCTLASSETEIHTDREREREKGGDKEKDLERLI